MSAKLNLHDFGVNFGSRWLGTQMRAKIESLMMETPGIVVVDAAGVGGMSHSFADECFGKLAERVGLQTILSRLRIENADQEVIPVIRHVITVHTKRIDY